MRADGAPGGAGEAAWVLSDTAMCRQGAPSGDLGGGEDSSDEELEPTTSGTNAAASGSVSPTTVEAQGA